MMFLPFSLLFVPFSPAFVRSPASHLFSNSPPPPPKGAPSPLSPEIQSSISELLATLDKVLEGSDISLEETSKFESLADAVIKDVISGKDSPKVKLPPPPPPPPVPKVVSSQPSASSSSSSSSSAPSQAPPPPPPPSPPVDNNDGDTGGLLLGGMSKGTRNTYAIPDMDKMSPEEYRAALQKTVIEKQEARMRKRGGRIGNIVSRDYMDSLSNNARSEEDNEAAIRRYEEETERRKNLEGQAKLRDDWGTK